MKRAALVLTIVLRAALCGRAYDWPAEAPTVVATFGQSVGSHYGTGIAVVSPTPELRPIAGGELVFWYDPERRPSSFPRGLGAHVVIQHPEKVRSVYTNLAPSFARLTAVVAKGTVIGRMGDSGAARGALLGLGIFDMETASYLNPLVVLPPRPDGQRPVISRVLLRRGEDTVELAGNSSTSPGAAEVLVEAFDLRGDVSFRWRLAPYSISLSVNGRQTSSITFDSLRAAGVDLAESTSGRVAASVYAGPWLVSLGEVQLQLGETHLLIFVRDFAGNEVSREIFLSIRG